MKLKKDSLVKKTIDHLSKSGFYFFKDSITPADGLFVKPLKDNFFLSLGFTISRYYNSQFNASFYLSKVTRWGSMWGDIPKESFKRIGEFLSPDERKLFLEERYTEKDVVDAWWSDAEGSIKNFLKVVDIVEDRFLNQKDLFLKIDNSIEVKELLVQVVQVQKMINILQNEDFAYQFIPSQTIDNIDVDWFKAAERALIELNAALNENTVKNLAADAYRQWMLTLIIKKTE